MKKLLLTINFIVISLVTFAQGYANNNNKITFGLVGGANFASIQVSSAHQKYVNANLETPFSLGLNADFKINNYFSIRPGIFYSGKGGTMNPVYTNDQGNVSAYDDYKLHYLEIPIDFIGHLPVGNGANIFLGAGPYFSWGLNGTNTQTLFVADPVVHKINYGKDGDFKSTDFGATTVLGFQTVKGVTINFNLDWGFTNILQNNVTGFDATQFKTTIFYLSIGQSF